MDTKIKRLYILFCTQNLKLNILTFINCFQYFMETKKEISLEEFMSNGWSRLKQLILAENMDVKGAEHPAEEENDRQVEEGEEQDENEDESEPVEDEVKYTDSDELDESQYDEETKLIVEGK